MSDKPLVQQALAADLAELLLQINPSSSSGSSKEDNQLTAALGFLKGFWQAIVREWTGVDRLRYVSLFPAHAGSSSLTRRMDKFYLLMRRYVNATFRLLARHGWSKEAIDGVNEILSSKTGPLT
jgi:ribosomal RNA-processing protein 1